jgi:hypothetical protein
MPTLTDRHFSFVELLGKISSEVRKTPHFSAGLSCRDDWIRTPHSIVPNVEVYRAALYPFNVQHKKMKNS